MTLSRVLELIGEVEATLATPLSQEWHDAYSRRLESLQNIRERLERRERE